MFCPRKSDSWSFPATPAAITHSCSMMRAGRSLIPNTGISGASFRTAGEFSLAAADYTLEDVVEGKVPFNLDHVDFINPNYPLIAREVRAGRSGVTNTFNVGGIPRVMAYAPILYKSGPYDRFGVFGGITIGVQTDKFKEPALLTRAKIDEIVLRTKQNSLVIISITAFVAILLAFVLSRKLTRPILLLSDKAKEIATGHLSDDITISTGDELEMLAHNFVRMVVEITDHRKSLEHSLSELAESKKFVEQYTFELEKQVRILKSVHSLSHYLGNEFDRELVLQQVLQTCVTGLGFDRSILYLYDPPTRRLICHQTFGFSSEHEKRAKNASYDIDLHDCVPTRAFRSGETIFIHDIHTDQNRHPSGHQDQRNRRIRFFRVHAYPKRRADHRHPGRGYGHQPP